MLKEPNHSPGADARDQLNKGEQHGVWYALARWAVGRQDGFPPYEPIASDRLRLNAALRRLAVINLKKISGGASADGSEINRFAVRDRALLRQQIRALDPEMILACGTFDVLPWLLEAELPEGSIERDAVWLRGGRRLIRWRHPARSRGLVDYLALQGRAAGSLSPAG